MLFQRIKAIREYDHDITTNLLNPNKNQRRIACVCVYIYVYILRLRCTNTFKLIFYISNLHSQVSDCNIFCLTSLTLSSAFLNAHWVWDSRTDKWVKERMTLSSYWSRSAAKERLEVRIRKRKVWWDGGNRRWIWGNGWNKRWIWGDM